MLPHPHPFAVKNPVVFRGHQTFIEARIKGFDLMEVLHILEPCRCGEGGYYVSNIEAASVNLDQSFVLSMV